LQPGAMSNLGTPSAAAIQTASGSAHKGANICAHLCSVFCSVLGVSIISTARESLQPPVNRPGLACASSKFPDRAWRRSLESAS
jgi:hypothetical protein